MQPFPPSLPVPPPPIEPPASSPWRARLHEVIYEADTPAGRCFDLALLVAIGLSVLAVCLESVPEIRARAGVPLRVAEWVFTGLFSIEYVLRLLAVRRPAGYALSFFGIVDLLAVLPTYLSLVVPGAQSLLIVRVLRLLRVFRVLKMITYLDEARMLGAAFRASRRKITVFLGVVMTVVLIAGALIYVIEGEAHGFTSIPLAVYWAVVTMTTVGYGDLVPVTVPGRVMASLLMITGYAIIAVPTGIVSAELSRAARTARNTQVCPNCAAASHADGARFCDRCGSGL